MNALGIGDRRVVARATWRLRLDLPLKLLLFLGFLSFYEATDRFELANNFSIDGVRNVFLLYAVCIAVLVMLSRMLVRISPILRLYPMLAFLSWALLSMIWTTEPAYTLREGLKVIYLLLVYTLAAVSLRSSEQNRRMILYIRFLLSFYVLLSVVIAVAAIALGVQHGTWAWGQSRLLDFPFMVPTWVASAYVILEFSGWQRMGHWRPRWWLVGAAIAYVLLSLTRADVFGLLAAITAVFLVAKRSWLLRISVLAAFVGLLLLILAVDNPIKNRMFRHPHEVTISSVVNTVLTEPARFLSNDYVRFSGRFYYWRHLLSEAWGRRPASIGAGLGSSRPIMRASRWETTAHGDFVAYLAELGYVGFALFVFVYIMGLIWSAYMATRKRIAQHGRAAALALCGHLVLGIVVGLVYNPFAQVYTFGALGVCLASVARSASGPTPQN